MLTIRVRRHALVLATFAALLAPLPVRAGTTSAPPAASCDSPPSAAQASPDDCRRFISLWTPRVTDRAWLQSFVDAAQVPDAITQEGFHALDKSTQAWLVRALVESLVQARGLDGAAPGVEPAPARLQQITGAMTLVVFGKDSVNRLRSAITAPTTPTGPAAPPAISPLQPQVAAAEAQPQDTQVPTAAATPQVPAALPLGDLTSLSGPTLRSLASATPVVATAPAAAPPASAAPAGPAPGTDALLGAVAGALQSPPVATLLDLVDQLAASVDSVVQTLLATPPLNALSALTYRVCSESATRALACTGPLPMIVPIPVDVTGDGTPDVLTTLSPVILPPTLQVVSLIPPNVKLVPSPDVGAAFQVQRLPLSTAPLPVHVFAVYDPPSTSKRIEFGYDGRRSTLAQTSNTTIVLHNGLAAASGDVNLTATVTHIAPGADEALTAAEKTLAGQPAREVDPITAAVRFTPVPASTTVDVRLAHRSSGEQDTVTIDTPTSSTVSGVLTQDVNSTSPISHRETDLLVDQLPSHVKVDVLRQNGGVLNVTYAASAVVGHVHATQTSLADVTHPGSWTRSDVDVLGLPSSLSLALNGTADILYGASSVVPRAQFVTQTQTDGTLQHLVGVTAAQVPASLHITQATAADTTTATYDAGSSLGALTLVLQDVAADRLVVNASATSLPTHATLMQAKSSGVVDYSANGPIGTLQATVSRAGGAILPLNGDHASVLISNGSLGVDVRVAGLVAAHYDPSKNATFALRVSPGGQAFEALARIDSPNRVADVTVSNLPSSVDVILDGTSGLASYSAGAPVSRVSADYRNLDSGLVADIVLAQLPAAMQASWQTGSATPHITYNASGRLGSLAATYTGGPGAAAFTADASDLPPFLSAQGLDPLVLDARSSATAASGSDHIGRMLLRYASDGGLATVADANDHVYVNQTGGQNHDELLSNGARLLSVDTTGKQVHAELGYAASRPLDVSVATSNLTVSGFIHDVPTDVRVDIAGQEARYTASSTIAEVAATVDRLNGEHFSADLTGIPASVDVVFDSAAARVTWAASGATGGVDLSARFGPASTGTPRTYDASVQLTGIPASWSAQYATGHVLFAAAGGAIAGATAAFTNHLTVSRLFGRGISVNYDEASGDLDAFVSLANLTRVEYQKLGGGSNGLDASLVAGDGSPFALSLQYARADGTQLQATGSLSSLPPSIHVRSENGVVTYSGSGHPTLLLDASYGNAGALAATPFPNSVHGVSIRDGFGCTGGTCGTSVRAHVFLTGFPDGVTFDTVAGTYTVTGFAPTQDPFTVDVILTSLVSTPVTLLAVQHVGTSSPVSFTLGPITTGTDGSGGKLIHAAYAASRAMGALDAHAVIGNSVAELHSSSIPTSIVLDTVFGSATKTIDVTMGSGVAFLDARYRRSSDASWIAEAQLSSVPSATHIVVGKQDSGQGVAVPVFSYHASSSGMGLFAYVDASAFSSLDAAVTVFASNLGRDVTGGLSGTTLQMASSPATGSFTLVGTGSMTFDKSLNADLGVLVNKGFLHVNLAVRQLIVGFTNMSSLTIKLGLTSAIEGSYGTFTFSEDSDTHLEIADTLGIPYDLGIVSGTITVFNLPDTGLMDLGNVIGNFRMADNVLAHWFGLDSGFPCPISLFDWGTVKLNVDLRPHPRFTTGGPSFTVSGSDAGGGAWLATINPWAFFNDHSLGDGVVNLLDIAARFLSPDGGDQGVHIDCT